jgi:hypothetical protein
MSHLYKLHDEILSEYEAATERHFGLSRSVIVGSAAVKRGNNEASPPLSVLDATEQARVRWEVAKKRLHDFGIDASKRM